MNKLITTIAILALCSMVQESYAQDKAGKNQAHIKIVTDENGEETSIDTVIDLNDLEGNIHEVLERFHLDDELKEASEALKNIDIDLELKGEEVDMTGIEDAMKWVGEALDDIDFNIDFDSDENITIITTTSTDSDTRTRTRMTVKADEEGYSYETLEGDDTTIDVDLDGGNGQIVIRDKDGNNQEMVIDIDEDGIVKIMKEDDSEQDQTVQTQVKMIELDGAATSIEDENDEVEVTVVTDKDGNKETKVIVKTITMNQLASDIESPELPENLDLQVYPNPNRGSFVATFRNDRKVKTTIRIFDTKGSQIFIEELGKLKGIHRSELDLHHLKPGNYIIEVDQGKSSTSQQFVIQ